MPGLGHLEHTVNTESFRKTRQTPTALAKNIRHSPVICFRIERRPTKTQLAWHKPEAVMSQVLNGFVADGFAELTDLETEFMQADSQRIPFIP